MGTIESNRRKCLQCGEEKAVMLFKDEPGKPFRICAECRKKKGTYKNPIISGMIPDKPERYMQKILAGFKVKENIKKLDTVYKPKKQNMSRSTNEKAAKRVHDGLITLQEILSSGWTFTTSESLMERANLTTNHMAYLVANNIISKRKRLGEKQSYTWNSDITITESLVSDILKGSYLNKKASNKKGEDIKKINCDLQVDVNTTFKQNNIIIGLTEQDKIDLIKLSRIAGRRDLVDKLIDLL